MENFRGTPSRRCSHRMGGWRMAAVMRAATKGANRESRGSPTALSSHRASTARASRIPSLAHSLPRSGQESFLSSIGI